MDEKTIRKKHSKCCMQSFKTRLELFLFKKALNGGGDIDEFAEKEFMDYNFEDIEKYAGIYWQQKYDYKIDGKVKIEDIYSGMENYKRSHVKEIAELKKNYKLNFHQILPYEIIKDLLQGEKCEYCNVTQDDIDKLIDSKKIYKKKDTRDFTLEIDRKEANKEYTSNNIVLCCYWCNSAKTDEFTDMEFRTIGEKIGEIWKLRLAEA